MRYFFLFLLFLLPTFATAQIEATRPADFRYNVTVDGDTLSSRSLDYKAFQDGVNYKCAYPDGTVVIHPIGVEISGDCPETIITDTIPVEVAADTVYADTMYVNLPPHDNSFLHSVDWTHEVDQETGNEKIRFLVKTEDVDTLFAEVRCGNEWVKEAVFPDSTDDIGPPDNELQYGVLWDCNSDLIYHFRAQKGVWEQAITERFPAFAFELTESEQALVDSVKKKSDVDMGYFSITNDSLQWTNAGHDNAVFLLDHPSVPAEFWQNVSSDGGNIRVYFWDGSQEIAVAREVVDFDDVDQTGLIFFDSSNSLANTANEWRVYVEDGATEPAASDPLGSEAVWGNYDAVIHNGATSDATFNDNTFTDQNGLVSGGATGQLGDATNYNELSNEYSNLNSSLISNVSDFTIQAWVDVPDVDEDSDDTVFSLGDASESHLTIYSVTTFGSARNESRLFLRYPSSTDEIIGPDIRGAGFTKLTARRGGGQYEFFSDNVSQGTIPDGDFNNTIESILGAYNNNTKGGFFNGIIDEVRVTTSVLSNDHLSTEYNNQSDPDNFWSVSAWQEVTETLALSGSISSQSSISGGLLKASTLSGDIDSASAFAGSLVQSAHLSGSIESTSFLQASASQMEALSGVVESLSQVDGELIVSALLSGQVSVESVLYGNIIIVDEGVLSLSGSIQSESSISGNLSVLKQVRGIIESQTDLSGDVIQSVSLSGDILTISSLEASTAIEKTLAGSILVSSEISGELSRLGEAWVGRIDITSKPMHTIRFQIKPMHKIQIQVKS